MPGIAQTPMVVASTLLDKVQQDQVEALAVCIKWKTGDYCTHLSTQKTSDLLMHRLFLDRTITSIVDDK